MKLPVIRHLQKGATAEQLETTLEVLEHFSEHRSVTEEEMDVVGELITNICGALEVHANVDQGMSSIEAANAFAQKVMGSIDK
jgi:pyrroline-5-carboxylate reductase